MKSLIVLKGLVKYKKINWVTEQGLDNFLLDIDTLKRLYYKPEYLPNGESLVRSHDNLIYEQFIRIICHRLNSGCLVVIDLNSESSEFLESLAIIYGYTLFYKVFETPKDFVRNNKNYQTPLFQELEKSKLKEKVSEFSKWQRQKINITTINTYQDIEKYWNVKNKTYTRNLPSKSTILHISDLHSNWELYKQIKFTKKPELTIFHGDYIDGPEKGGSRKLLDLVISNKSKKIIYLEGNHELRLRKYLGAIWLWNSKKTVAKILYENLPEDFLNRTAPDFKDLSLDPSAAREYLIQMNNHLQEFIVINWGQQTLYCTHSGFKYVDQICPKYVGNVIYGLRNIDKVDSYFSKKYRKKGLWSIHAHCQYPMVWDPFKYENVINLDPEDENKIDYIINEYNKSQNICVLRRVVR